MFLGPLSFVDVNQQPGNGVAHCPVCDAPLARGPNRQRRGPFVKGTERRRLYFCCEDCRDEYRAAQSAMKSEQADFTYEASRRPDWFRAAFLELLELEGHFE